MISKWQQIVWTAVPIGRDGNFLDVSVLISPRLGWEGEATVTPSLGEWMDFRGRWWPSLFVGETWRPATAFTVHALAEGKNYVYSGSAVTRLSADPIPDLFDLLLPFATPVQPWQDLKLSTHVIRSYSASQLSALLDRLQLAAPRDDLPTSRQVISYKVADGPRGLLDDWDMDRRRRADIASDIAATLAEQFHTSAPDTSTSAGVQTAVMQLVEFLRPPEVDVSQPLEWTRPEFHELISLLGSHPNLLRALGLLVDLRVDISGDPLPNGRVDLRVAGEYYQIPQPPPFTRADFTPPSVSTLGPTSFTLARRVTGAQAELTSALFASTTGWSTVTSEVEFETVATLGVATAVSRGDDYASHGTPERVGLPARSSAGIALVRPDMAESVRDALSRSWQVQSAVAEDPGPNLYAEDLTLGYRVDVRRVGSADWRSLHRRAGILTPLLTTAGLDTVDLGSDEGWVELATTDGAESELRLSETVARWTGWSLSLPRPGAYLDADNAPTTGAGDLPAGIGARIDYSAPAGGALLPTLRFDTAYDLRLRAVDVTGNSPAPDSSGPAELMRVTYRRHEPVSAPDLFIVGEATEGETADVLVVRSEGAGAAVGRAPRVTVRTVAPPRVSAWLAEQHGCFDDAQGRPKSSAYEEIASRDEATYAGAKGAVPYLPDPMAQGLAVRFGPREGAKYDARAAVAFPATWPDRETVALRARPAQVPATARGDGGIDIAIPPGRVAKLKLSCTVSAADLNQFDVWSRLGSPQVRDAAARGDWWQITPYRVITVVHATRKPVSAPRFAPGDAWTSSRPAGAAAATVSGVIRVDQPSTASVSFTGRLLSGVDRGPGTAAPRLVDSDAGVVGTADVDGPDDAGGEAAVNVTMRVAVPDTKARELTVAAVATSRYAEYFRRTRSVSFATDSLSVAPGAGTPVVPGSVRVEWSADGGTRSGVEGDDFTVDATAGTITRAGGSAIPRAEVTISWIAATIILASEAAPPGQRSASLTLGASARPLAPEVAWTLPTFAWNSPGVPSPVVQSVTSRRTGGGLRLYLQRPWWSSGLGEELAVVLLPAGTPATSPLTELATRWASDPATMSAGALPVPWPTAATFTNRRGTDAGVPIAEVEGLRVDIARYTVGDGVADGSVVGFDAARDLWFVDLEMDEGAAYRPFVRLGLARYQPAAPRGLCLSPITILDVVQLEPDRTANVSVPWSPRERFVTATVTLTGPSYQSNEAGRGPGRATLIYETNASEDLEGTSLTWTESDRIAMSSSYDAVTGIATWTGRVRVSANRARGRHRLVVEQFEDWRRDGRTVGNDSDSAEFGLRLVHQDIIRL